jgi:hypothetical protein
MTKRVKYDWPIFGSKDVWTLILFECTPRTLIQFEQTSKQFGDLIREKIWPILNNEFINIVPKVNKGLREFLKEDIWFLGFPFSEKNVTQSGILFINLLFPFGQIPFEDKDGTLEIQYCGTSIDNIVIRSLKYKHKKMISIDTIFNDIDKYDWVNYFQKMQSMLLDSKHFKRDLMNYSRCKDLAIFAKYNKAKR